MTVPKDNSFRLKFVSTHIPAISSLSARKSEIPLRRVGNTLCFYGNYTVSKPRPTVIKTFPVVRNRVCVLHTIIILFTYIRVHILPRLQRLPVSVRQAHWEFFLYEFTNNYYYFTSTRMPVRMYTVCL